MSYYLSTAEWTVLHIEITKQTQFPASPFTPMANAAFASPNQAPYARANTPNSSNSLCCRKLLSFQTCYIPTQPSTMACPAAVPHSPAWLFQMLVDSYQTHS